MEDMLIRHIVEQDFDMWLRLWKGYNAFYCRSGATALPAEVTNSTWTRFFDPSVPVWAIVAESDGQLVGLAHYVFHLSTISIAPVCYLQDLFTAERARGRGVARALIEQVYAEAKAVGSARVYWQTRESNTVARALYDRIAEHSDFIVYRMSL